MTNTLVDNLERMLAAGKDGALLRFGLGNAHMQSGNSQAAIPHLQRAVELDPGYSAAWKLLGKAMVESGDKAGARAAYESGVAAAQQRGDKQALREMMVFLRRLDPGAGNS
ncbi:MAG: tetratricopeptide repeat protein [Betaproteobacteria bacterium]